MNRYQAYLVSKVRLYPKSTGDPITTFDGHNGNARQLKTEMDTLNNPSDRVAPEHKS